MRKLIRKVIPYNFRKKIVNSIRKSKVNIYNQPNRRVTADKKVSVVIPNYNYSKYLEERIDSVMMQSYPIYELIILDDCSSDNSLEVIDRVLNKYKDSNVKIKKIYNKENSGSVFSQWQKGFTEATGDYIWIAEADDSCNLKFLENVMKAFKDEKVAISYSESMRIDENNYVIQNSCRDWMPYDICEKYWNKNYIHDGIYEIKSALSVLNTIPNVSTVVFKNDKRIVEYIEAAKSKYRISGDWYIYYQILKTGKIGYCSKSLNYFRKHSQSTSTVAKKDLELKELLDIQYMIRTEIELTCHEKERQITRYENLIKEVTENTKKEVENKMVKRIAWVIPFPIKGSGGIRTMINNANFLVRQGYIVDVYVEENYITTDEKLKKLITEYYGECLFTPHIGIRLDIEYDLMFATYSIKTAEYVKNSRAVKKAYFIQDYEPWFEPVGNLYLEMERSYKLGLDGVSIGKWLANKLEKEHNTKMNYFDFCADLNIYKPLDNVEKENAVCFIYQPDKPRRCSKLGLDALKIVKTLRPDVNIYLYGSDVDITNLDFEVKNLKIVSQEKCNELYNKCVAGLCISSSNPSRIPFEMMAAGLPVVDLYRENNIYDMPSNGVLLADATPTSIANALIKIIDDKKLQKEMSKFGKEYMKDYPIEKGYNQFLEFVKAELKGEDLTQKEIKPIYDRPLEKETEEVKNASYLVDYVPVVRKDTSDFVRKMVAIKKGTKHRIKKIIMRIFRI